MAGAGQPDPETNLQNSHFPTDIESGSSESQPSSSVGSSSPATPPQRRRSGTKIDRVAFHICADNFRRIHDAVEEADEAWSRRAHASSSARKRMKKFKQLAFCCLPRKDVEVEKIRDKICLFKQAWSKTIDHWEIELNAQCESMPYHGHGLKPENRGIDFTTSGHHLLPVEQSERVKDDAGAKTPQSLWTLLPVTSSDWWEIEEEEVRLREADQ